MVFSFMKLRLIKDNLTSQLQTLNRLPKMYAISLSLSLSLSGKEREGTCFSLSLSLSLSLGKGPDLSSIDWSHQICIFDSLAMNYRSNGLCKGTFRRVIPVTVVSSLFQWSGALSVLLASVHFDKKEEEKRSLSFQPLVSQKIRVADDKSSSECFAERLPLCSHRFLKIMLCV